MLWASLPVQQLWRHAAHRHKYVATKTKRCHKNKTKFKQNLTEHLPPEASEPATPIKRACMRHRRASLKTLSPQCPVLRRFRSDPRRGTATLVRHGSPPSPNQHGSPPAKPSPNQSLPPAPSHSNIFVSKGVSKSTHLPCHCT